MPVIDDHFWDYLFTRRRAVFDGSQLMQEPVVLTDETGTIVLTDESGDVILTTGATVNEVVGQLVRWI
jgi:hypothetical protein